LGNIVADTGNLNDSSVDSLVEIGGRLQDLVRRFIL